MGSPLPAKIMLKHTGKHSPWQVVKTLVLYAQMFNDLLLNAGVTDSKVRSDLVRQMADGAIGATKIGTEGECKIEL